MSSRSFRRRNNRRRHRSQQGGEPRPGAEKNPGGPEDRGRPEERGRPENRGRPDGQKSGPQRDRGTQGKPGQPKRPENGRRGPGPRSPEVGLQRPEQPLVFPDCPICSAAVRELPSALTHRATGRPAHFECILKELRESNELLPQEKLCYLGGGSFGILEMRPPGGPSRFVIRKRIQYEEKDAVFEWKKVLVYSL